MLKEQRIQESNIIERASCNATDVLRVNPLANDNFLLMLTKYVQTNLCKLRLSALLALFEMKLTGTDMHSNDITYTDKVSPL